MGFFIEIFVNACIGAPLLSAPMMGIAIVSLKPFSNAISANN
jgi:hypothetical protein